MEYEAFRPLNRILTMDLSNNQLRELPPLPESLLNLNLGNNQLALIPACVANLMSLTTLNVSGNRLDSSTPFSLLSGRLESLDLSNNLLDRIPIAIFKESRETIEHLDLSTNNITQVPSFLFQNFSLLTTVRKIIFCC